MSIKKIVLVLGIGGLILFLVTVVITVELPENSTMMTMPTGEPLATGLQPTEASGVTPNPTYPPLRGDKIQITKVWVRDFLQDSEEVNSDGDRLIDATGRFRILYIAMDNSFLLSILDSPFAEVRSEAEQAFLGQLEISREDACQLKVAVTTPQYINPVYAGKVYGLSFCEK